MGRPVSTRTCDISGCDRPRRARGFCRPHYRRWARHVDTRGRQGFRFATDDSPGGWYGRAEQVLDLGVAAEDFGPSLEARRKEYEEQGLAEWEIELLLSHNRG